VPPLPHLRRQLRHRLLQEAGAPLARSFCIFPSAPCRLTRSSSTLLARRASPRRSRWTAQTGQGTSRTTRAAPSCTCVARSLASSVLPPAARGTDSRLRPQCSMLPRVKYLEARQMLAQQKEVRLLSPTRSLKLVLVADPVPPLAGHPRQDPPPLAVARCAPGLDLLCVAPGDQDRPGQGARLARVGVDARDGRAVRRSPSLPSFLPLFRALELTPSLFCAQHTPPKARPAVRRHEEAPDAPHRPPELLGVRQPGQRARGASSLASPQLFRRALTLMLCVR